MGESRRVSTEFQRTLNTEIAFEEEAEKAKARKAAADKDQTTSGSAGSTVSDTENKA